MFSRLELKLFSNNNSIIYQNNKFVHTDVRGKYMDEDNKVFSEYEDIVSIDDIMKMLHIGRSNVYKLLRNKEIKHIRVGVKYIVPKVSVIEFIMGN